MGVHGLSTFITENKRKLLREFRLHDNRLVVDANNLCHYLYYNFHLKVQYGGQYDQFAKFLRLFLQTLQNCHVEVVMVFDGAYAEEDRKFETTLKRFNSRLETAAKVVKGQSGGILPILTRQVFVQVLKDLEITHITSDYEADNDLASIAKFYQCPVLSNDSDFYIYNLPAGFIPLDSLDITEHTDEDQGYHYIKVKLYKLDWFLEEFECKDSRLLGLLATLVGNDFITNDKFLDFYSILKVPERKVSCRVGRGNTIMVSRNRERIGRLLEWLKQSDSFRRALDIILSSTKSSSQQDLEESIMKNIDMYSVEESGILDYLKCGEINEKNSVLLNRVPKLLLSRFRSCRVEPDVFNSLLTKRVWLLPQVEDLNRSSSYRCSSTLREVLYSIMEKSTVTEYDRELRSVVKRQVQPKMEIENFGQVPSLSGIVGMDDESKRRLFYSALECHDIPEGFDESVTFLIVICAFWIRHANSKLTLDTVRSLLLSYFKVEIVEKLRMSVESAPVPRLPNGASVTITAGSLQTIGQKFGKLQAQDTSKYASTFIPVLHSLAQFQTCFLGATHLHQSLDRPDALLSPRFYNGLLMHNLAAELKRRSQPEAYVMEFLGGKSSQLWQLYEEIQKSILALTGAKKPLEQPRVVGKSKKKRKAKAKAEKNEVVESEEENEDTFEFQANCDLSNKFGLLLMTDD